MNPLNKPEPHLSMIETQALVDLAKEGNGQALQALFERYYEKIRPIIRSRMGKPLRSKLETEDLLHSAFGEALRSLNRFEHRSEGDFLHWLSAIVTNLVCNKANYFKAAKRDFRKEALAGSAAENCFAGLPAMDPTPSQAAARREMEERLFAAMDILDQEQREVLYLSRFLLLGTSEMGRILGCSQDAARMRARRAEAALAEAYMRMEPNLE